MWRSLAQRTIFRQAAELSFRTNTQRIIAIYYKKNKSTEKGIKEEIPVSRRERAQGKRNFLSKLSKTFSNVFSPWSKSGADLRFSRGAGGGRGLETFVVIFLVIQIDSF